MKEVEIMGPKRLSRGDVEHPSFGVFKISLDAHWMGMMEISGCASSWEETRWCPRSIPSFFFLFKHYFMSSYCRSHSPEKPSRRVKAFIYTIRHRGTRSGVDKTSWRGELLQAPKLPTRGEHPSSSTRRHLQPTLRQQRGKNEGF